MAKPNTSISNSKKPTAFLIAVILFVIFRFGDLLLPINFFTHRIWEALLVYSQHNRLPGPFYPNQSISTQETGDLAPYTRFAVKKMVTWETDRYGYRKKNSNLMDYPIVIVGDSTILGTSLDQSQILSEVLERNLKEPVYPYAPHYNMEAFIADPRFQEHPPKTVIFAMMEWAMPDLLSAEPSKPHHPQPPYNLAILLDRISKQSVFRYFEARLRQKFKEIMHHDSFKLIDVYGQTTLYPAGKGAHPELPESLAEPLAEKIDSYEEYFKEKGIRFMFLGIPNKETLYYRLIEGRPKPKFFPRLMAELEKRGIDTVDALKLFQPKTQAVYQPDDTHWNPYGVEIVAKNISERLSS